MADVPLPEPIPFTAMKDLAYTADQLRAYGDARAMAAVKAHVGAWERQSIARIRELEAERDELLKVAKRWEVDFVREREEKVGLASRIPGLEACADHWQQMFATAQAERDALRADAERLVIALEAMLSLVRREAPELAGKVLGDADSAINQARRKA